MTQIFSTAQRKIIANGGLLINRMYKTPFIMLLLCLFLAACNEIKYVPAISPSLNPESNSTMTMIVPTAFVTVKPTASATVSPTQTSTPTRIQPTNRPPAPTATPFPVYPNKKAIFDYYVLGNLAEWIDFFDPPSGNIVTKLVLYDDGQLIAADGGETYKQKQLESAEIEHLFSELEALGFYSIESNQKHDQTDKLYNMGNDYQETSDGLRDCVTVNAAQSRTLCVREDYVQYLTPEMKAILQFVDGYKPAGMLPYYPDRILLTIQSQIDPSIENPPAVPWNDSFPALQKDPSRYTGGTGGQVMFVDGELAQEIASFFGDSNGWKVVSQNGKDYIVSIRVLLPDETVKNPQQ